MSTHRDSSYAKCPHIAVCSGIKGITPFKLSMLLLCSQSSMIIYYNYQKPYLMGLKGRSLNAELMECFSFTLQSSSTMALGFCHFLCSFPKMKSCFPDILDRFFNHTVPVISECPNPLRLFAKRLGYSSNNF